MKIKNYKNLKMNIAYYRAMFPETYTTLEEIVAALNKDYRETGGVSDFGISVSSEWEDKCYGFSFNGDNPYPSYTFTGIVKC